MTNRHLLSWQSIFLLLCLGLSFSAVNAQNADTTVIQTFSFSDPAPPSRYQGTFQFPPSSESYQKILMYYTLKCDASTQADQFPCGEWDYLSYTFLVDSTGLMDSTRRTQTNYVLGAGGTPDSTWFSLSPTWTYRDQWQYFINHNSTLSLDSAIVGTGTQSTTQPFTTSDMAGRAQYLWRESEMTAADLTAGDITGLRLDLSVLGSEVRNLEIRIRHTAFDTLSADQFEDDGFTSVYYLNTTFANTGWNDIQFTQPFNWDGSSNIVIDFVYENMNGGTDNEVLADQTAFQSGVYMSGDEYFLEFAGGGEYVNLGNDITITGNAERTIEMWAYARAFNGGGIFQFGNTGSTARDFSLRTVGTVEEWRVQLWGTPDFNAVLPGSNGEWHHYAVTYDGTTARLYYDGVFMAQRAYALNTSDVNARLARWAGSFFTGYIDEVRVWDKALDAATIEAWMDRSVDATHPDYANLQGYYPMNEGMGATIADMSGNGNDGFIHGGKWRHHDPRTIPFRMMETSMRPNVVLLQGTYTSTLDSILVTDSVMNPVKPIIIYGNNNGGQIIDENSPLHPSIPTDTLLYWAAGEYTYTYDGNGMVIDSAYIPVDTTLYRDNIVYYSAIVRYEIGRYITPYGINLDLGPGFTWVFDITDYAPLLHDHVYLEAGNNQELLDLKFIMIEGTPPRDVRKISKVYDGNWSYSSILADNNAPAISIPLDPDASYYRVKTRTTGHGFGTGENCAEFCYKTHYLDVDGVQRFNWVPWDECATNPLYPQGGTWIYDRAGWCPGEDVRTFNHELTPYVTPGDTVELDYSISPAAASGAYGNYVLRTHLVTYDEANFDTDVSLELIQEPNEHELYGRTNPICSNPVIIIKNKGEQPLTKVTIRFGVVDGFKDCEYVWTGNLDFLEEAEIELPIFNWTGLDMNNPRFFVELIDPNDMTDENPDNNYHEVPFDLVPEYAAGIILEVKTNSFPQENYMRVYDNDGTIVYSRNYILPNLVYNDTIDLPTGCYKMVLKDTDQDGISWWANNDGNGYVRLKNPQGLLIEEFEPDFGDDIYHEFTIGYQMGGAFFDVPCGETVSVEDELDAESMISVYPNPTQDRVFVAMNLKERKNVRIEVYNTLGVLMTQVEREQLLEETVEVEMPENAGVYFVKVVAGEQAFTETVIVN